MGFVSAGWCFCCGRSAEKLFSFFWCGVFGVFGAGDLLKTLFILVMFFVVVDLLKTLFIPVCVFYC